MEVRQVVKFTDPNTMSPTLGFSIAVPLSDVEKYTPEQMADLISKAVMKALEEHTAQDPSRLSSYYNA